ncbi:MAG: methyltransferase domain-containing protein [Marivibrio sp.]|uniref:methyltransferase domain-containing protein n=1 Tax=Marivibrio sp. TaxID=2039719 RepID=UPI0032EB1788
MAKAATRGRGIDALLADAEERYRQGDLEQSAKAYDAVLARDSDHIDALEWRGEIAVQLDDYETAADMLGRARTLRGDDAFAEYTNLGLAYYELGRAREAVDALVRAVRRDGGDLVSHSNLGKALYEYHHKVDAEDARRVADDWLKRFPDNPDARHIGAAVSGRVKPEIANADYVADVFDDYAPNFDEKIAELSYQAPEILARLIAERLPKPDQSLSVLDAGCGTGLAGKHLRPYAARLDGVDLSQKMIAKAEEKGFYDMLARAELISFLDEERDGAYDLIAAADVLCYFGALDGAFVAFAHALKSGGSLVFTVEKEVESDDEYRLDPSGRYKHAKAYVEAALARAGLRLERLESDVLRYEYGEPVRGLAVLAAKD